MVPIANVPLLVRTLRLLASQGITEIAVNLYHRPEAIREALGNGSELGVSLHYSDETQLMGTAGGVKRMEEFLDETFLILYGDNLYQADFAPLLEFHRAKNALATIATFTTQHPTACGLVGTDETGRVTRFQEKPPPEAVFTDQANAGVYILEPEIFRFIPANTVYDFGKEVFPALLAAEPDRVFATPLNGYLQDTGTVLAYRQANWDLLEGRAGPSEPGIHVTSYVSPDATLSGRNMLGARVTVEAGATVEESILWEETLIGTGATVTGAILGRSVTVGPNAVIETGAIVADGVMVSADTVVEANAHIAPGEIVV